MGHEGGVAPGVHPHDRPLILGLTGSIGMGKTTTTEMFAAEGIAVHSADTAVHALYAGKAAPLVGEAFPGTLVDGKIDRERLSAIVLKDRQALTRLENLIHPLVHAEERAFIAAATERQDKLVVLDIPLLYETGADKRCDKVVVVSAPASVQRSRVLERAGMSDEKFAAILEKQLPDAEKRKRADFIIETGNGLAAAHDEVRTLVACLRGA